jgi:RNA polymerase sigma factor (sigma-70 family)
MDGFLAQRRSAPDKAFERLYERHVGDVYRFAAAMLSNPADAEDVVQTTFLNAYRAFEHGQRPDQPRSWLIAIANNVCRQRFRQQSRRPNEVELDDDIAAAPVDEERVGAADIQRALSELAFNQRAALVMRELEGRSYAEIAETLGLTHAAVETLIFRARRALREQLEGGLTCSEAERAISLQLDGMLPLRERGALRAHLRACADCRGLAKRTRGQRSALRSLGAIPLPATLASGATGGGGAAAVGAGAGAGGIVLKIAAVTAAVGVAGGGVAGYEEIHHSTAHHRQRLSAPATVQKHVSSTPAARSLSPKPSAGHGASGVRRVAAPVRVKAVPGPTVSATPAHAPRNEHAAAVSSIKHSQTSTVSKGRAHAPGQAAKSATATTPTRTTQCKQNGKSSASHSAGHGKQPVSKACAQPSTTSTHTTPAQDDSGPPPQSGGDGHGSNSK